MNALAAVDATPGLAAYMSELEARLLRAVERRPGFAAEVAAEALSAGGKRLRPLLCFLSSATEAEAPVPAGVAVELVHMATLVHDDLVDGLIRLMQSGDDVTGPINIGNPKEFSMLQLASEVIDLTGARSRIVHRPLPQDDPRQRRPDISKANDLLGWAPRTDLKYGLTKTIAYFDELLKDQSIQTSVSGASVV